jgi:hypothetical protein
VGFSPRGLFKIPSATPIPNSTLEVGRSMLDVLSNFYLLTILSLNFKSSILIPYAFMPIFRFNTGREPKDLMHQLGRQACLPEKLGH